MISVGAGSRPRTTGPRPARIIAEIHRVGSAADQDRAAVRHLQCRLQDPGALLGIVLLVVVLEGVLVILVGDWAPPMDWICGPSGDAGGSRRESAVSRRVGQRDDEADHFQASSSSVAVVGPLTGRHTYREPRPSAGRPGTNDRERRNERYTALLAFSPPLVTPGGYQVKK